MRNLRLLAISTVLVAVVLVMALGHHPQNVTVSKCGAYRNDKTIHVNKEQLKAEQTKSQIEFDRGLGGRQCIESDQAMLFTFDKPGHYPFWMKDMTFPIDIVWIGADHKVAGLETNVQPSTYPDRFVNKEKLAQYVLELQANRANSLHIDVGTPVNF